MKNRTTHFQKNPKLIKEFRINILKYLAGFENLRGLDNPIILLPVVNKPDRKRYPDFSSGFSKERDLKSL
jgi:hypothetical protein